MNAVAGDVNEKSSGIIAEIASLANRLDVGKSPVVYVESDKRWQTIFFIVMMRKVLNCFCIDIVLNSILMVFVFNSILMVFNCICI